VVDRRVAAGHGEGEVGGDQLEHLARSAPVEGDVAEDGRVVHPSGQRAGLLSDLRGMPGDGGVTRIAADEINIRVLPIQLAGHVQDNDTPRLRQAFSDGAANSLRRAGHDKRRSGAHGCPPRVAGLSGLLSP
jgi:hypothetical protein